MTFKNDFGVSTAIKIRNNFIMVPKIYSLSVESCVFFGKNIDTYAN